MLPDGGRPVPAERAAAGAASAEPAAAAAVGLAVAALAVAAAVLKASWISLLSRGVVGGRLDLKLRRGLGPVFLLEAFPAGERRLAQALSHGPCVLPSFGRPPALVFSKPCT